MDNTWINKYWKTSISAQGYNPDWWDYLAPTKESQLWKELQAIYDEELSLGEIPDWAQEIVVRMMELPMCGYYAFPENIFQILTAINQQKCPSIVMRCYTVDSKRKILMMYYIFCLDAWAKDAQLPTVIAEYGLRKSLDKDWNKIASSIYNILGQKTELKQVTVQRLIHRLRWWVKSLIWQDDKRDLFMLDFYGGDIRGDEQKWGAYGNSPYGDPYFTELQLPAVKLWEQRILEEAPNGIVLLERIHSTWLCAPKAFRYLEKLIAEIGTIDYGQYSDKVSVFLQCEDTYPDFSQTTQQYNHLTTLLGNWLSGDESLLHELQHPSPVQHWLVHILWHKLVFHGKYEQTFGRMVGKQPHGKGGTRPLLSIHNPI